MKHQIEGLDFIENKAHAGLFYEMRLGKTLVILEHAKNHTEKLPVLLVAPLSVVTVWQDESKKFDYDFKFVTLTGTRHDRIEALNQDADFYVINYEGLRIMSEALLAKGFKMMVMDESHRAKSRTSQQTQVALKLASVIPFRYILTGTPITNTPEDLWSQIHFLKPGYLSNFYAFQARYIEFRKMTVRAKGGLREIQKPYRSKNADCKSMNGCVSKYDYKCLRHTLDEVCLRKTQAECLDLPEKSYKVIPCPMSREQSDHYFMLKNSLATMIGSQTLTVQHAITLIQKLKQVCQGFIYDADHKANYFRTNGKLIVLKDLLEDLKNEKIILFTYYQAETEMLQRELGSDYKIIIYDGSAEDRQTLARDFKTSEAPCIFLSNIDKAKEGINLQEANHVIYFGNSYNYGSRYQSESRALAQGKKENVIYYDLVCPKTIDERVVSILNSKKQQADIITGDSLRLARMAADLE